VAVESIGLATEGRRRDGSDPVKGGKCSAVHGLAVDCLFAGSIPSLNAPFPGLLDWGLKSPLVPTMQLI
jgi:hypothetical protein